MAASKPQLGSGRERGTVIVEMAVALPLLLLMVAGIVDLGFLFWEKEVLTNAAREGARAGARAKMDGLADQTVSQVRTIVQDYLRGNNIKDAAGALITLTSTNCTYTWDTTTPATIKVELKDIPVKMMLLPNIQTFYSEVTVSNTVYLNAKISMAAEWTTHP